MTELGRRRRAQPAPPRVIWEALIRPGRPGGREWLRLLADEVEPTVRESRAPDLVVWESIWPHRPDDRIVFDIAPDGAGSMLCWTLLTDAEPPGPTRLNHLRQRLNQIVNADLRRSFGQ